jgi:hypothetical protein
MWRERETVTVSLCLSLSLCLSFSACLFLSVCLVASVSLSLSISDLVSQSCGKFHLVMLDYGNLWSQIDLNHKQTC